MTRKFLLVLALAVLTLASGASAQVWTSVASVGTLRSASSSATIFQNSLTFATGVNGNIWANYNVTNPRDTSTSPAWTTFEFTAKLGGANLNTFATATLFRMPRGSASVFAVCTAIAPNTGALSTSTCTFSSSLIDFANNYYFVEVDLGRDAGQSVVAYQLRVF